MLTNQPVTAARLDPATHSLFVTLGGKEYHVDVPTLLNRIAGLTLTGEAVTWMIAVALASNYRPAPTAITPSHLPFIEGLVLPCPQ